MAHADAASAQKHYVKIWLILLALLAVSIIGPMLGHPIVTLVTAFGIAAVKAYLVAKNFMHLTIEKRWVTYMIVTMLALMVVFVGGVAPDVLKHDGHRWENVAAKRAVEKGLREAAASGGHHGKQTGAHPAGDPAKDNAKH